MRIMNHDSHHFDRSATSRTASPSPHRSTGGGPRSVGDRSLVRWRVVPAPHRPTPGSPSTHRPRGPQGLRGPRHAGALPRHPRTRPGPGPAGEGDRPTVHVARPRADVDQPTVGRRPRPRHQHRPPPDPPLLGVAQGRLSADGPDGRPQARPVQGRAGRARPGRLEKKSRRAG
jgi:hypothetical protein